MTLFAPACLATAADLLAELDALGVRLAADGTHLRFRPREKVTAELAERMKAHKPELLARLGRPVEATVKPKPPFAPAPAPPDALADAFRFPLAHELPDAWFKVGAAARRREQFAADETGNHPSWWSYLHELCNRGLTIQHGRLVEVAR
jgi:hypothetical protein